MGAGNRVCHMTEAESYGLTTATRPQNDVPILRGRAYRNAFTRCLGKLEDHVAEGDRAVSHGLLCHPSLGDFGSPIHIAIPEGAGSADCCAARCRRSFSLGGPGALAAGDLGAAYEAARTLHSKVVRMLDIRLPALGARLATERAFDALQAESWQPMVTP